MARGRPDTLVLEKLPIKETTGRAPGPGPIQLSTWRIYAERYISKAPLVLHTDAAKAYSKPIEGVLHTKVIHQQKKEKKKVNGKWVKPHFTKKVTLKTPRGQVLKRMAGTQTVDGLWTTLRKNSRKFQGDFHTLDDLVRFTQWKVWCRGQDLITSLARTCR